MAQRLLEANLPIFIECLRAPLRWSLVRDEALSIGDDHPPYWLVADFVEGSVGSYDPWEMRTEFFGLDISRLDNLVEFLNRVGHWDRPEAGDVQEHPQQGEIVELRNLKRRVSFPVQSPRDVGTFIELRDIMQDSVLELGRLGKRGFGAAPEWRSSCDWFSFESRFESECLVVSTKSFLEAVSLTIHVDRLLGAQIKKCKRPDCATVFSVKRKGQKFCDPYCGHLQSLRRKRGTKPRRPDGKKR